jgi:hypothetical protein
MRLAAADAHGHARVVVGAVSAAGARCQAQLSAAEKPPALDRGQRRELGQRDLVDLRAGRAQRRSARSKRGAPPARARRASSSSARPAQRRSGARAAHAPCASSSCSSTASRTERVIAQRVSSVVDSGIAPSAASGARCS